MISIDGTNPLPIGRSDERPSAAQLDGRLTPVALVNFPSEYQRVDLYTQDVDEIIPKIEKLLATEGTSAETLQQYRDLLKAIDQTREDDPVYQAFHQEKVQTTLARIDSFLASLSQEAVPSQGEPAKMLDPLDGDTVDIKPPVAPIKGYNPNYFKGQEGSGGWGGNAVSVGPKTVDEPMTAFDSFPHLPPPLQSITHSRPAPVEPPPPPALQLTEPPEKIPPVRQRHTPLDSIITDLPYLEQQRVTRNARDQDLKQAAAEALNRPKQVLVDDILKHLQTPGVGRYVDKLPHIYEFGKRVRELTRALELLFNAKNQEDTGRADKYFFDSSYADIYGAIIVWARNPNRTKPRHSLISGVSGDDIDYLVTLCGKLFNFSLERANQASQQPHLTSPLFGPEATAESLQPGLERTRPLDAAEILAVQREAIQLLTEAARELDSPPSNSVDFAHTLLANYTSKNLLSDAPGLVFTKMWIRDINELETTVDRDNYNLFSGKSLMARRAVAILRYLQAPDPNMDSKLSSYINGIKEQVEILAQKTGFKIEDLLKKSATGAAVPAPSEQSPATTSPDFLDEPTAERPRPVELVAGEPAPNEKDPTTQWETDVFNRLIVAMAKTDPSHIVEREEAEFSASKADEWLTSFYIGGVRPHIEAKNIQDIIEVLQYLKGVNTNGNDEMRQIHSVIIDMGRAAGAPSAVIDALWYFNTSSQAAQEYAGQLIAAGASTIASPPVERGPAPVEAVSGVNTSEASAEEAESAPPPPPPVPGSQADILSLEATNEFKQIQRQHPEIASGIMPLKQFVRELRNEVQGTSEQDLIEWFNKNTKKRALTLLAKGMVFYQDIKTGSWSEKNENFVTNQEDIKMFLKLVLGIIISEELQKNTEVQVALELLDPPLTTLDQKIVYLKQMLGDLAG